MVANDTESTMNTFTTQFEPNKISSFPTIFPTANKMYTIEEASIPFTRPEIKKANLTFKEIQSSAGQKARRVLACDDGNFFEEGLVLKDARYGNVHRMYALQKLPHVDVYMRTGKKLAVKKLNKRALLQKADRCEKPLNEISTLQLLSALSEKEEFQCFNSYYDCYADFETIYLIVPYFDSGDLLDVIDLRQRRNEEITIPELKDMFFQISEQIQFFHSHGLVHRDLSLENILYDKSSHFYGIIDFGMSILLKEDSSVSPVSSASTTEGAEDAMIVDDNSTVINEYSKFMKVSKYVVCGKNNYIAPELWQHATEIQYMMTDIWSLGIIFFMMFMLQAPFETSKLSDKRYREFSLTGNIYDLINEMTKGSDLLFTPEEEKLIDLIDKMLKPNPNERITISQVLSHPFFD